MAAKPAAGVPAEAANVVEECVSILYFAYLYSKHNLSRSPLRLVTLSPLIIVRRKSVCVLIEILFVQVKLADSIPSKKNQKEPRKADKKSADVLSSLNNLSSAEEKLSVLCKKYTEITDDSKKMQVASKNWEKKCVQIQREKDQIQSEFNKTILLKSKLESLCRELQRQIKTVKVRIVIKLTFLQ